MKKNVRPSFYASISWIGIESKDEHMRPSYPAWLTHHQHRSWFLRATAMLYSASVARLSSVGQSVTDVLWLNGAR